MARRTLIVLATIVLCIGGLGSAWATPIGWTCYGACGTTTGTDGVVTAPPNGSTFEWISTNGGMLTADLNAALDPDTLNLGITEDGSVLRSNLFTAAAGDKLDFYFNYITSDRNHSQGELDYAWARVIDTSADTVAWLFSAQTSEFNNPYPALGRPVDATLTPGTGPIIAVLPVWSPLGADSGTCFQGVVDKGCGYTGWIHSEYTLLAAGSYLVEFGVLNFNDDTQDSGLALNGNLIPVVIPPVDPPPNPQVPEPSTFILLGTAAAAVMFKRVRDRR